MKKIIAFIIIGFILITGNAYAADKVSIQIPTFDITINDQVFDNQHATYPFIMYKGITYVPLTYNLCRELGVITGWDSTKGLYLSKYKEEGFEYSPDLGGSFKRGAKYTADIPGYPVYLNGVNINSNSEKHEYPILIYNNITYLPLTWEYVYYEFGWDIAWDSRTGLNVNSDNCYNGDFQAFLSEINKDYAIIQSDTVVGGDDNTMGVERVYNYKLDFKTNKLTFDKAAEKTEYYDYNSDYGIRCDDGVFTIEDTYLEFNGQRVEKITDTAMQNPNLYALKWSVGDKSFYEVTVYTNNEIPAPYTPFTKFVYEESAGALKKVDGWDTSNNLDSIYKIGEFYYLCSDSRYVTGRFNNSLSTVMKLDSNGKSIVINNKYEDYMSIRAIGATSDGRLVVKANYFGNPDIIDNYSDCKVSAINDGFFYLDQNDKLTKIQTYVSGETFLAPNGHLYLIIKSRLYIIDLTTGERIKLSK